MTAAATPPATAGSAHGVDAAGDHRRPQTAGRRATLVLAVVLSAASHALIGGLVLRLAPAAVGGTAEEVLPIEIVVETAPVEAPPLPSADDAMIQAAAAVPAAAPQPAEPPPLPQAKPRADAPPPVSRRPASPPRLLGGRAEHRPSSGARRQRPSADDGEAPGTTVAAPADGDPPIAAIEAGEAGEAGEADKAAGAVVGTRSDPARGQAPAVGRGQLLSDYGRLVWARIAAHRPQGLRMPGSTLLSFTVAADGSVLAATVARSSGSAALDRLALQALARASPFPPPPALLGPPAPSFVILFEFR